MRLLMPSKPGKVTPDQVRGDFSKAIWFPVDLCVSVS